jgi:hypothetical protein
LSDNRSTEKRFFMNQSRGYWTADETAEYYHVPLDTLRYWRHMGKGPAAVRPGKDLLYPVAEIERYDAELLAQAHQRAAERNPQRPALAVLPRPDEGVVPITRRRGRARSA